MARKTGAGVTGADGSGAGSGTSREKILVKLDPVFVAKLRTILNDRRHLQGKKRQAVGALIEEFAGAKVDAAYERSKGAIDSRLAEGKQP